MSGTPQLKPKSELAREAVRAALKVRSALSISATSPTDPFLIAERLGIEVRIERLPQLDGFFVRQPARAIVVSSSRPLARQVFTCAHEIAHDVLNHQVPMSLFAGGQHQGEELPREEYQANVFAGALLMPALAINAALTIRGVQAVSASPNDVYEIACSFGVGYETLAWHMSVALNLITVAQTERLLKVGLASIRQQLTGRQTKEHLAVVSPYCLGRPIDVHTGDVVFSKGLLEEEDGSLLGQPYRSVSGWTYPVSRSGLSMLRIDGVAWSNFLRASRPEFSGRAIYRHLGDEDED